MSTDETVSRYRHFISKKNEETVSSLYSHLREHKLCDVVLIAGIDKKRTPAHRLVLSASSDYFYAMFNGGLKESIENEVVLHGITGDVLKTIVQFCYTGFLEFDAKIVHGLLSASSLMLFQEIVDACSLFLIKQLEPSNCLSTAALAEQHNCTELLTAAKHYAKHNFLQTLLHEDYVNADLGLVKELIGDSQLNVHTEDEVFKAVMLWINHNPQQRMPFANELLYFVRMPFVSTDYLLEYFSQTVDDELNAIENTIKAVRCVHNKEYRRRTGNIPNRILLVNSQEIHTFNPENNTIQLFHKIDNKTVGIRFFSSSTILGEKLIFVEGRVRCNYFDLKSQSWHYLPPMKTFRNHSCLIDFNGCLYSFGGSTDFTGVLDSVERLDIEQKEWTYVASMRQARKHHSCAVLEDKIYIVGGVANKDQLLNSVECYNPRTNQWKFCAPLTRKRRDCIALAIQGSLYVFGPSTGQIFIEKYDPVENTWTIVHTINCLRFDLSACVYGEKILLLGGFNDEFLVEEFDPKTNKCKTLPSIKSSANPTFAFPISHYLLM